MWGSLYSVPLLLCTSQHLHNEKEGNNVALSFLLIKGGSRYGFLLRMRPHGLKPLPKASRMSSMGEYYLTAPLGREQEYELNYHVSIIRCQCELHMLEHPA